MKVTQKQFLADVMHEIEMLKKHTTKKEKKRLNIKHFNPDNVNHCIYGQITGDCRSHRALELMEKSCVRVFNLDKIDLRSSTPLDTAVKYLNGSFEKQGWVIFDGEVYVRSWKYLSALEGYIQLYRNNAGVIAYIKGEIDTLKL